MEFNTKKSQKILHYEIKLEVVIQVYQRNKKENLQIIRDTAIFILYAAKTLRGIVSE